MDINSEEFKKLLEERYPSYYRKRPYGKIRIGYRPLEDDPHTLVPDPEKVVSIEKAMDYVEDNRSFREVCDWLGEKLLAPMSHQSVNNLYDRHRKPFSNGRTKKGKTPSRKIRKKMSEAMKLHHQQNRYDKLKEEALKDKAERERKEELAKPVLTHIPKDPNREVVFQPNPGPQTDFLASPEQEVLYGGAAGGGKSYAMLADPMRYFTNPHFSGLLLRRTNDELRELISKSQLLYKRAFGDNAKWSEQKKEWSFKWGGKLWITYLDRDEDVLRYQGQAFTWIGFDELTQYPTPYAWNYLRSRLRATGESDLPLIMRATSNPGGPGHNWVKQMFIDPAAYNTPFWARDDNDMIMRHPERYPFNHPEHPNEPHPRAGKPLFMRKFIPASLYDNPYLVADGNYEANLASLPEAQRKKLLEGDWDIVEGAAFPEFRHGLHTVEPFDIPHHWRRFRACDFGYSSYSAVVWFAIEPGTSKLYIYDEMYVSKKTAADLAQMILIREQETGSVSYGVLDSSAWHQRGHLGPSIAEEMITRGVKFRQSDRSKGSRAAGFNRLHELLKVNEMTEEPGLQVFENCRNTITQIPSLPMDKNGEDDIDSTYATDHIYDAIRYGIMTRPKPFSMDGGTTTYSYNPADATFGY